MPGICTTHEIPEELDIIMKARDIPSLYALGQRAQAVGQCARTFMRVLVRNSHESLESYWKLSRAAGVTMDTLRKVLLAGDGDVKRLVLGLAYASRGIKSLSDLARAAKLSETQIFRMLGSSQRHVALSTYGVLADILRISLEDLAKILRRRKDLNLPDDAGNIESELLSRSRPRLCDLIAA